MVSSHGGLGNASCSLSSACRVLGLRPQQDSAHCGNSNRQMAQEHRMGEGLTVAVGLDLRSF